MTRFFFIHGAGCTGDVFRAQTEALPNSWATTLPGHGQPGEPTDIAEFAEAVTRELQERAFDDVILAGHSMGGAIALELALRHDPRVRAVVLLDSGARLRVAPALFESLERDFRAGARALAALFFADPTPERVDAATAMMCKVGREQTLRDFRACDAFNATERIGDVRVPLLALTGECDLLTPPKFAQFLADRVPGAEARILPEAGHFSMLERPEETNLALQSFARRIANR